MQSMIIMADPMDQISISCVYQLRMVRKQNLQEAVILNLGYKIDTDWKPVRIELYSDELGYLDIHPFVLSEDGTSKQADLEGGWYEFEKDYFGSAFFEGKTIPCISLKGQRVFHSGYELRDKDKHDISILESLSK